MGKEVLPTLEPIASAEHIYSALVEALRDRSRKEANVRDPQGLHAHACSSDGCHRPALKAGMCNAHYLRSLQGRDMTAPLKVFKKDDRCQQCGCRTNSKGGWGLCRSHYKHARQTTVKLALIELMGGRCQKCFGVFPREVFDFHHIGDHKTENPSAMFAFRSAGAIAKEMSHCVLLCSNCHRQEHVREL